MDAGLKAVCIDCARNHLTLEDIRVRSCIDKSECQYVIFDQIHQKPDRFDMALSEAFEVSA